VSPLAEATGTDPVDYVAVGGGFGCGVVCHAVSPEEPGASCGNIEKPGSFEAGGPIEDG
jgi:hypothetical protein